MRAAEGQAAKKSFFERFARGSISRKYSLGYLLMLIIVVVIFAVSFFTGEALSAQYR